jgi:hypothetical protein
MLINIFCNICFYLLLLKSIIIFAFLLIVKLNLIIVDILKIFLKKTINN